MSSRSVHNVPVGGIHFSVAISALVEAPTGRATGRVWRRPYGSWKHGSKEPRLLVAHDKRDIYE